AEDVGIAPGSAVDAPRDRPAVDDEGVVAAEQNGVAGERAVEEERIVAGVAHDVDRARVVERDYADRPAHVQDLEAEPADSELGQIERAVPTIAPSAITSPVPAPPSTMPETAPPSRIKMSSP